jgi:hypothetical protein
VDEASLAIGRYCRQVGRLLSRRGSSPTAAETQAANEAVDAIAAVAREKPSAEYRPGQSMRDLVADAAENLEASNCSRQLVARLEHVLVSLPSGD